MGIAAIVVLQVIGSSKVAGPIFQTREDGRYGVPEALRDPGDLDHEFAHERP